MRKYDRRGYYAFVMVAGLFLASTPMLPGHAVAFAYGVISRFCHKGECKAGGNPQSGLVMDKAGNLYGTAAGDGIDSEGSTFELIADGKKWQRKTLHVFCSAAHCADGSRPFGTLVVDTAGNLYGTTYGGGGYGYGTVFELMPNADGSRWKIRVLHSFCAQESCPDGGFPMAGLAYAGQASGSPYDGSSPLYGTTYQGGAQLGDLGVVFEIRPQGKKWSEETIYSFCSQNACIDGSWPIAGVTIDASSNLYGTTSSGGDNDSGVVFELSQQHHGQWSEDVLYSFCSLTDCADGADPYAGVMRIPREICTVRQRKVASNAATTTRNVASFSSWCPTAPKRFFTIFAPSRTAVTVPFHMAGSSWIRPEIYMELRLMAEIAKTAGCCLN